MLCVRDKSLYSDFFNSPRGVKQGCLLSPQLFSLLINELALEMSRLGKHGIQMIPGAIELFLLLFADDVILLSDTVMGLQNQLNILKREADRLQLTVNLDKTNIMVFRNCGHLSNKEIWRFGDQQVTVTNNYKYLGVIFTTRLSLNVGWEQASKKGRKAVIEILRAMRKLGTIDTSIMWKLFDTQIQPMLSCGAEVWGLSKSIQLEAVHTFAIKRFLNVPLHSSNKVCYGETGRCPLHIRNCVKSVKYWLRLIQLPLSRLNRQAYEMLLQQFELGKQNWVYDIKKVLSVNGFGIVWLSQGVGNESVLISKFKDRLISRFKQDWHSDIEEKDKYNFYVSFKSMFHVEYYLLYVTHKWHRDMLARFRTGTFGLNAKKRWFEVGVTEGRNCPFCPSKIEDEIHFVFDCVAYEKIRETCSVFNTTLVKMRNITAILTSEKEDILKSFAKYVAKANDIRKKRLEKGVVN